MPDKRISDLTAASTIQSADLFVLEQSGAAKKLTGQTLVTDLAAALDGHGGISSITWSTSGTSGNGQTHTGTIHYADGTTSSVEIKDGYKGTDGVGVPSGGTTGQALVKSSGTDYATTWSDVYKKPSGGIPKTDLAAGVQSSLGLADTAIQSASDVVFWATYGSSTYGEIGQAITDNRPVMCARNNRKYVLERTQMVGVDVNCIFTAQDKDGETYYLQLYSNGNVWSEGNTSPHNIPSGGTSGQYLKKASSTDYDVAWGEGASDYSDLTSKPQINGVTLSGNKSTSDLKLDQVYWATYGTTTGPDLWLLGNKVVACKYNSVDYYLAQITSQSLITPDGNATETEYLFTAPIAGVSIKWVKLTHTLYDNLTIPATNVWSKGNTSLHDIPSGGTTGQVLKKASNTDYDVTWGDGGGGGGGGTSDYTDLSNKPSINSVTLSGNKTASDLGLGTYSKPSGGIPKTDLASSVQTSLGKADSALQSAPVSSVDGKTGAVTVLPSGGSSGQVLKKSSGTDYDVEWANESGGGGTTEIFWATYGTTTKTEIDVALSADLFVCCKYNNTIYYLSDKRTQAGVGTTYTFVGMTTTDGTYNGPQIKYLTFEYFSLNSTEAWSNGTLIVPDLATATPSALGTAAVGTSKKAARADHVHAMPTAANVGAIAAPSSPSVGDFLVYTSNGWAAQSLSTWQGGSY